MVQESVNAAFGKAHNQDITESSCRMEAAPRFLSQNFCSSFKPLLQSCDSVRMAMRSKVWDRIDPEGGNRNGLREERPPRRQHLLGCDDS